MINNVLNSMLKKQKGAIILMFLVFLPMMLAFAGLAIDFGYIYVEKTKLQNAADAAALAGVPYLKSGEKAISEYVAGMLLGNSFTPTSRAGSDENLSKDANWKMRYERTKQLQDPVIVVDSPMDADRLRVSLFKTIKLIFLPIVSNDLASVDLTTTAVAENFNASSPAPAPDPTPKARSASSASSDRLSEEFAIIALEKFSVGVGFAGGDQGFVNIPSFRSAYVTNDRYHYGDFNKYLTQSVYTKKLSISAGSQLRIGQGGILYIDTKPPTSNYSLKDINANGLVVENHSDISDDSSKISTVTKFASDVEKDGRSLFQINSEKTNGEDVIKYEVNEENFVVTNAMLAATGKVSEDGFVKVPIVFYVPDSYWKTHTKVPTIHFNVSAVKEHPKGAEYTYDFQAPIIAEGANLILAGEYYVENNIGYIAEDFTRYSGDVYCLTDSNKRGGDLIVSVKVRYPAKSHDSSTLDYHYVKEFRGIVYANSINIEGFNVFKRHMFRKALIANNVTFSASEGSGDFAHKFELLPVTKKIRLVE